MIVYSMDGKYGHVCTGATHMTNVFVKRTILLLQCRVAGEELHINTKMKGLGLLTLVSVLLASQGLAQGNQPSMIHHTSLTVTCLFFCIDQCISTEQVERAYSKVQEQLDRAKAEVNSCQNQTLRFMQCPGQSVCTRVFQASHVHTCT